MVVKFTRVDLEQTEHEHELRLSFYDDAGAYAFWEWFENANGRELFAEYCLSKGEEARWIDDEVYEEWKYHKEQLNKDTPNDEPDWSMSNLMGG